MAIKKVEDILVGKYIYFSAQENPANSAKTIWVNLQLILERNCNRSVHPPQKTTL